MLDSLSTTYDWQLHPGRICVSAVGAQEQHSRHLPLCTDTIEGEYFARFVATELQVPLLPTLPIGTSLEQTGFRGSLTLRPETAMQIIRDLAAELEEQHFERWIIINAHGGNFFLNPVVRDLNRQNRRLKILLLNFWEFSDSGIAGQNNNSWKEIHCGDWETSLMLAIAPELVGSERIDRPDPSEEERPLLKADLCTFGFGHMAPEGAVGSPSLATAEKGRQIVESIKHNIIPFIKDRLRRLDSQPRYSGGGGIALRPLLKADVPEALSLTREAGWNQLENDWLSFIEASPAGMFAAVHNGRVIGTAATIDYAGRCAWIGMILVSQEFRRLGIATRLMQAARDAVRDCTSVKLDATPDGAKVYEKLNFKSEYELRRMICRCLPKINDADGGARRIAKTDLAAVAGLDAQVFGAPRDMLLRHLAEQRPDLAWVLETETGKVKAVCCGRSGQNHTQVGPVHADSLEDAVAVIAPALAALAGRSIVMDVPAAQQAFIDYLQGLGFCEERSFLRMYRGENEFPGEPVRNFAICGPEFG